MRPKTRGFGVARLAELFQTVLSVLDQARLVVSSDMSKKGSLATLPTLALRVNIQSNRGGGAGLLACHFAALMSLVLE